MGGSYQRGRDTGPEGNVRHGVAFAPAGRDDGRPPASLEPALFFWEEAQVQEHLRDAVNPGAPDWVP